jgi:hypothetical protein
VLNVWSLSVLWPDLHLEQSLVLLDQCAIMQILRAVSGHGDGQQCRRFADAELAR